MLYNPFPSIELGYGEDNKWFYILFEAIMRVDSSFIEYNVLIKNKNNDATKYKRAKLDAEEHIERVFAYELYRQWANILEQYGIKNLALNGEIEKEIRNYIYDNVENPNDPKTRDVYPDLVLHHSQGKDNMQLIVCEIKRSKGINSPKIFEDLHKLSCYLSRKIFWKKEFKYGVFIIAGKEASLEKIKMRKDTKSHFMRNEISFEDYKKDKNFKQKFKNIVCISYNGKTLEYDTLDNILANTSKPKKAK